MNINTDTKLCSKCNTDKLKSEFGLCRSRYDGLQGQCKICKKEYALKPEYKQKKKEYAIKHKERLKKYRDKYFNKNREKINLTRKENHKKLKIEILNHYGGECSCCGEKETDFLSIDHIQGKGNSHRNSLGAKAYGCGMYKWLKDNNFPKGFQVLCWNCNWSKFLHKGICIHKLKNKK